jgi:hypothetical protein
MVGLEIFGAATVLCLLALVPITGLLCRRVLLNGGHFEAEVRALALRFRVHVSRDSRPQTIGGGSSFEFDAPVRRVAAGRHGDV